jgi:nucleoside-diphosphate-sugar epimerase
MTIFISNSTGRTQGYVIRALLAASPVPELRLHVRSSKSFEKLATAYPQLSESKPFVAADPLNHAELVKALSGATVVWYNGPEFVPHETAMAVAMIEAAREAGVKHVVYSSTIYPLLRKCPNHVPKLR